MSVKAPEKKDRKEKGEKKSKKEKIGKGKSSRENGPKIDEEWTLGDELGRGAFSVVVEATHKVTGDKAAVKIIMKQDLGPDSRKNLKREIDILRKVDHPNIIALKDLFNSKEKLYLVMELVEGGELFDKIVERGSYTEHEAATLVSKIVSAILYLHDTGIVHRDLKPENLLLRNKNDLTEVCIADFGLSKIVGQSTMMQTACGTPSYVAPEVLSATGYGAEVDVWSIGVITYILLCGFPPFYGDTEIFEAIMAVDFDFPPDYWDAISEDAKDFIERMLVADPAKRITCREALEHPWIEKYANQSEQGTRALKVGEKMGEHLQIRRQQSLTNQNQLK